MIELWHEWNSVHSFKVRMVLEEKRIAWQGRYVELLKLDNLQADYLRLNPGGVVPTLVHDERIVTESSVICQYLEDAFPAPALMPADAYARAAARTWLKYFDDEMHGAVRVASFQMLYRPLLAALPREALQARLARHPDPQRARAFLDAASGEPDAAALAGALERFSRIIARIDAAVDESPWLAGESFSLADAAMAAFADRVEHLGLAPLLEGNPRAADWMQRVLGRPSAAAARAPREYRYPLQSRAA